MIVSPFHPFKAKEMELTPSLPSNVQDTWNEFATNSHGTGGCYDLISSGSSNNKSTHPIDMVSRAFYKEARRLPA